MKNEKLPACDDSLHPGSRISPKAEPKSTNQKKKLHINGMKPNMDSIPQNHGIRS